MREAALIFTDESVRGILAGRKTATRRIASDKPRSPWSRGRVPSPGDVVLVRETWMDASYLRRGRWSEDLFDIGYRADRSAMSFESGKGCALDTSAWNWDKVCYRSPLFLPKWATRIRLEVTSVTFAPLQAMTEEDARKEGIDASKPLPCRVNGKVGEVHTFGPDAARKQFAIVWDGIHGRGAWIANPEVWAIEFRLREVIGAAEPLRRAAP